MQKEIKFFELRSSNEISRRKKLFEMLRICPIPNAELLENLGLFVSKADFSNMLYIHELYKKQLDIHGIIIEFGVRWGRNLALFETFRGIYEPFNWNRKIVGFDTFKGFSSVSDKDGNADIASVSSYNVTKNYELYLEKILDLHEQEGVILNRKGYELIKGDASIKIKDYLYKHPETIISLAYFDMDIYKPTKECLKIIQKHLTKGSIVAFDELNFDIFPGETIALKEVFGLDKYKLIHTQYSSTRSYLIID